MPQGGAASGLIPQRYGDLLEDDAVLALYKIALV
jgi:hypothetical protein